MASSFQQTRRGFVTCGLPVALFCCTMHSAANSISAAENYALLIAVQDYDEKELRPLQFTRADILDFQKTLIDTGFKSRNVVVLHDDVAKLVSHYQALGRDFNPKDYLPEAAKIRRQLGLLLGLLQKEDSLVVAFTGHGVQFANDNKSYFCPIDADLQDKESLIGLDEIYSRLKECEAGRKLLLVDACQNDPQSRIGKARKTVDLESVTRPQSEPIPEGIIALFSCRAGQQSFEHPPLGHGVFFHHVLDGWKGKADLNGDLRLSYLELAQYAEKQTAEYAYLKLKVSQKPQLKAEFSGEWVLRELSKPALTPPLFDATRERTAADTRRAQDAWAAHLKTAVEFENSIGMKFQLVPPGEYYRGSTVTQINSSLDIATELKRTDITNEQPQHRVRLTGPVYVACHEVTLGQFLTFYHDAKYRVDCERNGQGGKGYDGREFKRRKDFVPWDWGHSGQTMKHPVVNVSWNDATAFCEWLSRKEHRTFRLPTEAEWEYACRAGTTTLYASGDEAESLARIANVGDALALTRIRLPSTIRGRDGYAFTSPVGSFSPNSFGLFDMHGNAWEWCQDRYNQDEYLKYAGRTAFDPAGSDYGAMRVYRGGGFNSGPQGVRSSRRKQRAPDDSEHGMGFRVVATLPGT